MKSFVILALNQESIVKDLIVLTKHKFAAHCLKGVYKGQRENSYMIEIKSMEDTKLQGLIDLATQYNQESILIVDKYGEGQLLFLKSGAIEYLGQWSEVSKSEALKNDAYTYDTFNDKYFLCKK